MLFCVSSPFLRSGTMADLQGVNGQLGGGTICPIFIDWQLPLVNDSFSAPSEKNHSPFGYRIWEAFLLYPEENPVQGKGWLSGRTCFSFIYAKLHIPITPPPSCSPVPWGLHLCLLDPQLFLGRRAVQSLPFILWRHWHTFFHCHFLHFMSYFHPRWPYHHLLI